MTDRFTALAILAHSAPEERDAALADFLARFRDDPLVVDKWLALQAQIGEAGTLDRVRALTTHPSFSMGNPNRVRALIGTFAAANQTQFHRADGAGHGFVVDAVLALDGRNPQVAARLLAAFKSWRALEPVRRASAEAALKRVAATSGLSPGCRGHRDPLAGVNRKATASGNYWKRRRMEKTSLSRYRAVD